VAGSRAGLTRYGAHFDRLAGDYDALRNDPRVDEVDALARAADLAGRTVLDVGCGTGRVAAGLAERHGCTVTGVDASAEMVRQASERGIDAQTGAAEALPFADARFGAAIVHMVLHLVDRPAALREIARVLAPGGRLGIVTQDPAGIEDAWLARLFPSYAGIDLARFPPREVLLADLRDAGFDDPAWEPYTVLLVYDRDRALERLRGRFASSLALIGDDELAAGIARAERELPERFEAPLRLARVTAAVRSRGRARRGVAR
jgi:SAM-dependent methyltransferase